MVQIITVLVLICVFCVYKLYKNSLSDAIREHVRWCVNSSSNWENLTSYEHLNNEQVDSKYLINTPSEKEIAKGILQVYQSELINKYFEKQLSTTHDIANLSEKGYYVLSLCTFFKKHECETTFNGNTMYTLKKRTDYGRWGSQLYDATYRLTEYGIVYLKMQYISQLLIENSDELKKYILCEVSATTKECLDKNDIEISRM